MKKILLDTSVVIDFLRRSDKEETLLFRLAKDSYSLYISIVTHTELYAGKSVWESKKGQQELQILFSGMYLLSLESEVSQKAGEIKAYYDTNLLDAIIAATAIIYSLELATLNIKDFQNIRGLKLYGQSL